MSASVLVQGAMHLDIGKIRLCASTVGLLWPGGVAETGVHVLP